MAAPEYLGDVVFVAKLSTLLMKRKKVIWKVISVDKYREGEMTSYSPVLSTNFPNLFNTKDKNAA